MMTLTKKGGRRESGGEGTGVPRRQVGSTPTAAANPAALIRRLHDVALRLRANDWEFLDYGIRALEASLVSADQATALMVHQRDLEKARAEAAEKELRELEFHASHAHRCTQAHRATDRGRDEIADLKAKLAEAEEELDWWHDNDDPDAPYCAYEDSEGRKCARRAQEAKP